MRSRFLVGLPGCRFGEDGEDGADAVPEDSEDVRLPASELPPLSLIVEGTALRAVVHERFLAGT